MFNNLAKHLDTKISSEQKSVALVISNSESYSLIVKNVF